MAHPTCRSPRRRARALLACAAVLAVPTFATTAQAHHAGHGGDSAPAAAPAEHAGHHAAAPAEHAAHQASTPAAAAAQPAVDRSMFEFYTPAHPRIAQGPDGLLAPDAEPLDVGRTAMGQTFGERYVAKRLAAAQTAERFALTTSQATKQLSKKCQRLVKITKSKDLKKLKKADKKARTKCLEQRRKLIADSKKKPAEGSNPGSPSPSNPSPNAPSPSNPSPSNPNPSSPGTTNPTPGNPNPSNPTTPNPNPSNPGTTTPNPTPECTTPITGTVVITAVDMGRKFAIDGGCGVKAGKNIQFQFVNGDTAREEHDVNISTAYTSDGLPSGTYGGGTGGVVFWSDEEDAEPPAAVPFKADLETPGTWYLICTVPGHRVAMRTDFKVFPA